MKKIILQIIIGLVIFSCSTTKNTDNKKIDTQKEKPITYDFADKVNSEQLDFIRINYNWTKEKILIINYSQPIHSCHYDNTKITSKSEKWWKDYYSKVNTEDCLNIKVLANGERVKRRLDNITYFDDKNDFFLNNFFIRKKSCVGILVLNDDGYYIQFNGEYSKRQVAKYIENLKK